jgi:hypothetical protein
VTVIALSGFVVVSEHTLPMRDKCEAVLVRVTRADERFWNVPNNDLGEQLFAVRDAIAYYQGCLQVPAVWLAR